jgi:hypothetical protein
VWRATAGAVDAARAGDRDAYEAAAVDLAALPSEQTGPVLTAVIRALLEQGHPDGLDGDDIQAVITGCHRAVAAWLPPDRVDTLTMVVVLASALGIHEPGLTYHDAAHPDAAAAPDDGTAPTGVPTPAECSWHAPLLVADLLGGHRLDRYLDAAFTEIARAETMEVP